MGILQTQSLLTPPQWEPTVLVATVAWPSNPLGVGEATGTKRSSQDGEWQVECQLLIA